MSTCVHTATRLALIMTVTFATTSFAAITVERDSTAFSSTVDQIEGDVVPSTLTDWSNYLATEFNSTNGDGTITMVTPNNTDGGATAQYAAIQHNAANDDFDSANGWTWETRFRIDSANSATNSVWEIYIRDNDSGLAATRIGFFSGGLIQESLTFNSGPGVLVDLTDEFHVVRGAVEGGTNLTTVWVDGVKVLDGVVSSSADFAELSAIGRWSGQGRGGTTVIDYIRFDTTGAYAPVTTSETIPAPAALPAGLALIGLAAARRRR